MFYAFIEEPVCFFNLIELQKNILGNFEFYVKIFSAFDGLRTKQKQKTKLLFFSIYRDYFIWFYLSPFFYLEVFVLHPIFFYNIIYRKMN